MKIIQVLANPYHACDADGVPQCVVGAGVPGAFIGAQFDSVACAKTGKNRFFFPANKDGSLAKRVIFSADIARDVQEGALLAADLESAAACNISKESFLPPDKALEAEAKKAQAALEAMKGKGAKLQPIPREATPLADGESLPPEKATKQITPTVKMAKEA